MQISGSSYPSFSGCTISNNVMISTSGSGVVTSGSSHPYFDNVKVENNVAESGSGFWIGKNSYPTISSSTIFNNTSSYRGGGIYLQSNSNASIINSVISNNSAIQGAGIYCETKSNGKIENSNIHSNIASHGEGGGIYLSCSSITLTSCTLAQNTAVNGAGLCIESCILTHNITIINNTTFTQNNALNIGGGIYITASNALQSKSSSSSSSVNENNNYYDDEDQKNQTPFKFMEEYYYDDNYYYFNGEYVNYSCLNCSFNNNMAVAGAGIYQSIKEFSITFGPKVNFIGNKATEMGGGIYIENLNDMENVETNPPLITGGFFSQNSALWAASTIGFGAIPLNQTQSDIKYFCLQCNFQADNKVGDQNLIGYQTKNGFATPPYIASFENLNGCPPSIHLSNNLFSVHLILLDQFNTQVTGYIFESLTYSYNITLNYDPTVPCSLVISNNTQVFEANGDAIFSDISLQGTDGNACVLQFLPSIHPNDDDVLPTSCSVELSGCSTGYHQETAADSLFDTCTVNTGISLASTITLTIFLLLIIIVLILVLCYCLFAMHRRQNIKPDRFVGSLPDFDRSEQVTIYEILNDPQIPVIPWENIIKYERIGIGGSGMVWRGEIQKNNIKSDGKGGQGRPVALKQLLFGIDNITEKLVWEFLREIKLMSALRHENVVEFIGVSVSDTEDQELYLVTELMQNGSLSDLFAKKKYNMPWPLRLRLIQDAACGMAYLHSRNLIHRDLKSQNLLVNDQWICKVSSYFKKVIYIS